MNNGLFFPYVLLVIINLFNVELVGAFNVTFPNFAEETQWFPDETSEVNEENGTHPYYSLWDYNSTDNNVYDYYSSGNRITTKDIENMLAENATIKFLESFSLVAERTVLYHQLKFCPHVPLCEFALNSSVLNVYSLTCCEQCICDYPICLVFNRCCPDILFRNKKSALDYQPKPDELAQIKEELDCVPLSIQADNDGDADIKALGYSHCPHSAPENLVENCTQQFNTDSAITDLVPVVDVKTLVVYRNRYCALCHGLQESDYESMQAEFRCLFGNIAQTEAGMKEAIFIHTRCELEFHTTYELKPCQTIVTECNVTGLWRQYDEVVEEACGLYKSKIGIFQNVFCGFCNGEDTFDRSCFTEGPISGSLPYSFSGLLKLGSGSIHDDADLQGPCPVNQIYDTITETCKDLYCSKIMRIEHGHCVDVFEALYDVAYTSYIRMVPRNPMSLREAYAVAEDIIDHIRNLSVGNNLWGFQLAYHINDSSIFDPFWSNFVYFTARLTHAPILLHDPYELAETVFALHDKSISFQKSVLNETAEFSFRVVLFDGNASLYDHISSLAEYYQYIYYYEAPKVLPLTVLLNHSVSLQDGNTAVPHLNMNDYFGAFHVAGLRILSLKKCAKVNISREDVLWKTTEDGMEFGATNFKLQSNEFYFLDKVTIATCVQRYEEFLEELFEETTSLSVEVLVSIICSSCSILCLFLTVLIFCIFPHLRRAIPGKNSMSLAFFLMCAQIMFLVSSIGSLEPNSVACKAIGIAVHYFWLVAIFWMNVCTYHMFRVLARTKVMSLRSGAIRLLFYNVYAAVAAAIFVSMNIALSYTRTKDIGYGRSVCYISSQDMMIYTFCVPAVFVILSNVIMYTTVVVKIKKSPSVQKNVQHERNDIIVFIKLSTITGITWIFGILNTWLDHPSLSYIFILLNASQGVFIMFAFVVNRRVYELLKKRAFCITSTSGSSTSRSFVYSKSQ